MSSGFRAPRWWRRGAARQAAGDAARDRREWPQAAEHYRAFLRLNPEAFDIWVQLGHMLKESQQYAEADQAYATALRLRPDDADLLLSLGHLRKLTGSWDDAIEFYRRSAALDDNPHALAELRQLGRAIDRPSAEARAQPPAAPQVRPAAARPFSRLWTPVRRAGDLARDRRRWPLAARVYGWHLRFNPRDMAIWVQLGHALKESGRSAEAADAYARAVRLDDSDADLMLNYGRLCQLLGRVDDAVTLYRRSTALDGNPHAREALQRLAASVSEAPADRARGAQLAAGDAARERGDWRLAAEHYRAYLRLSPEAFGIWVRLGHMLRESQQYRKAAHAYDTARRLNPDDAELILNIDRLRQLATASGDSIELREGVDAPAG